jgi:hypothetical protein
MKKRTMQKQYHTHWVKGMLTFPINANGAKKTEKKAARCSPRPHGCQQKTPKIPAPVMFKGKRKEQIGYDKEKKEEPHKKGSDI